MKRISRVASNHEVWVQLLAGAQQRYTHPKDGYIFVVFLCQELNAGADFLSRENRRGGAQAKCERRRAFEPRATPGVFSLMNNLIVKLDLVLADIFDAEEFQPSFKIFSTEERHPLAQKSGFDIKINFVD